MHRTLTLVVLAAMAGCLLPVGTAHAQTDKDFAAMRKQLAAMEAKIQSLEAGGARQASYYDEVDGVGPADAAASASDADGGARGACPTDCCSGDCCSQDCETCCSNDCCGGCCVLPCVPIFGFEYVSVRPYDEGGQLDQFPAQMNFRPSYRIWMGWQRDNGQGGRIRYWEFDQGESFNQVDVGLEFRTLDAELTQEIALDNWSLLFSGGLRYAESRGDFDSGFAFQDVGFSGTGLTGSVTAARNLFNTSAIRLAATARWSTLFGNRRNAGDLGVPFDFTSRDLVMHIFEITVGPQTRYEMSNGMVLFAGGGLEAQHWTNTGIFANDDAAIGLFGLSTNFGVSR